MINTERDLGNTITIGVIAGFFAYMAFGGFWHAGLFGFLAFGINAVGNRVASDLKVVVRRLEELQNNR